MKLLDGRARLGESSPSAGARRIATRIVRRSIKAGATPALAVARRFGLRGLPRGAIRVDDLCREGMHTGRLTGVRFDLSEPARALDRLGVGSEPPATAPVTTAVTMLDGSAGSLAFAADLVVDWSRRIVFPWQARDDGRFYKFRDFRVSWTSLDEPKRVPGSIGYLSNTGVHNFGHWFLFVYPLIEIYRAYLGEDPDRYYVGGPIADWHYESLEALGITRDRIETRPVTGDRMLAAIVDRPIPPPTSFIDFSANARPPRRVFISRRLRPTRPLLNEAECVEVLERYGFEVVCTETLTLREELSLFADAEVVVGVHGAGLTNLLFCNRACVAIELFPNGYSDQWFTEVAAARGLTYGSLTGDPTPSRGLRPLHYHLKLDPGRLEDMVAAGCAVAEARRGGGAR
jgi:hypothetical protein